VKYAFIRVHQRRFTVSAMCRVLQVSRSGYYDWRDRPECRRRREDRGLLLDIGRVHAASRRNYGARKTWVALNDPVPTGATLLGSGLGRDSAQATRTEKREGAAWLAYEERAQDAYRASWEFMPRGRHVVEYTMRLNSAGRFALPPSRVEAMYAPDSFGELPGLPLEVRP